MYSGAQAEVVHRKHWWFFVGRIVPWFVPIIVFAFIGKFTPMVPIVDEVYRVYYLYIGMFLLFMMAMSLVFGYIQWVYTTVTIDQNFLVYRAGILSRTLSKIPLREIASMDLRQSLFQRLLGMGSLIIDMRGASLLQIRDLEDPEAIQDTVLDRRRHAA